MYVDLAGHEGRIVGVRHGLAEAIAAAVEAAGCDLSWASEMESEVPPQILILSHDLVPPVTTPPLHLQSLAERAARAMRHERGGRILHLISAMALVPMRRHAEFSATAASIVAAVRALAMTAAPAVLVNALALGAIAENGILLAGDASMISHTATREAGTVADVVDAALFLLDPANTYMSGQTLALDGGWTAGYARNF